MLYGNNIDKKTEILDETKKGKSSWIDLLDK